MNLHQQLESIFPYMISIRKLDTYLSFDIEFPTTWKLPKKYVDEKMILEQENQKEGFRCFSFATSFEDSTINLLFENLKNIIKYNLEREEKEKLFETKVKELKNVFDKSNLDDLKELEFNLRKEFKVELDDEGQ